MLTTKAKGYRMAILGLGLGLASLSQTAFAACNYVVTNSWGSGFTAAIRITNDSTTATNGWQVSWSYTRNTASNAWNATLSGSYTATNLGWNGVINPGQTVEFGVQGLTNGGALETPAITGSVCGTTASSTPVSSSRSSSISSSRSSSITSSIRSSSINSRSSSVSSIAVNTNNIAPLATATTSYVSPWETLAAVNDNSNPANSNDKSSGAYGNWNNANSTQWVEYNWPQRYQLSSTQIYWFDDNGGVLTPTTAYIEYWNGSSWVNVGNVPLVKNAFNTLALNVVTSRLRVSMLNTSQSTGILEWRVSGTAISTNSLASSSSSRSVSSSSSANQNCTGPLPGTRGSNPIIPSIYSADPAVMVHDCTFYIAAGHDEGNTGFVMRNWYVMSSNDMVNWTYGGAPVMSLDTFTWADANAWAGHMIQRNGKFYWYVPVNKRGGGMAIGVAVSDSPRGPFRDAIGAPLIDDTIEMKAFNYTDAGQTVYTIDPNVFIDDNGQAYLVYGGFWRMVTVQLEDNMIALKGQMTESTPRDFFEAPYLTKRNGLYYMVYAAGSNPATIDYATATSPTGPWTYRGRILEKMPALSGQDAPTSHPAIAEFAGQWYLVYHISNGQGGGTYRRQVAIDKLTFNSNGTINPVTPSSGLVFDANGFSSSPSSSSRSSSLSSSSRSSSISSSSRSSSNSISSSRSSSLSSSSRSSSLSSSSRSSSLSSSSRSSSSSSSASSTGLAQCGAYEWPKYEPDLNYDFRTDFGQVDTSKFKVYYGCPQNQVAGVKTKGRFAFLWGPNRNPSITDADIDRVLTNLNEDADYIHNVMGWPVDKLQAEGYFSNIYLYGSGLCTDNAANTERGGWQSGINGYPMVLLSYYPVVTPSERGGITHEFIHTIMATRGNKAAWFNEGGNTWLQMNLEASRNGSYGVGFLDATSFLAPHMPIENYSGWLQDGTFGGPNAEGVDRRVNGQQISTWRDYLGGNQYNAAFPHFLGVHVSKGANAWIWAKGSHNHILRSLANGVGEDQIRRMIMEFRARQAMVDFGPWSNGFKVPINNNWGRTIGAEEIPGGILQEPAAHRLTFYAASTLSGDTLTPATDTLPGWSGANQIPLKTTGSKVRVSFQPIGQNMRMQLAYRAADGSAVYSQPVESGEACLDLTKAPKNSVVVAVVSNVDHLYNGEDTRIRKHDYRIKLVEGVSGTAPLYDKHYQ